MIPELNLCHIPAVFVMPRIAYFDVVYCTMLGTEI